MHRIVSAFLFAGLVACGQKAAYQETGGPDSIVSVGEVDIQEIKGAASGMLESLLREGVLSTAPNKPARVVVERVTNDTSSRFEVDELTYRMREHLVNSGQATVVTAYGGTPESREAQEIQYRKAVLEGRTEVESLKPDFILNGRITQLKRSAGNVRQTTYTYRLTLTNAATGNEAWTKTVDFTKQGTKDAVGF
jgi:PBP1b-binding outer membrane lipoprotein LpoB